MKTLQILTIASLLLGLVQTASAECEHAKHGKGAYGHSWEDADKNKDGVISREEFLSSHQARAEEMFAKLDTNKDGKVDAAEQKAIQTKCERHHKSDAPAQENKPK